MKALQKITLTLLVFLLAITASQANTGGVSGPSSAGQGSTMLYTFTNGTLMSSPSFVTTGATVVSPVTVNGTTYSVYITWSATATVGTVYFYAIGSGNDGQQYGATLNVTLVPCSLPVPSNGSASMCGPSAQVTINSMPASGYKIRWYKAGSNVILSTSATAGALSNYTTPTLTSTTTYQATAFLASNGCESAPQTITASIISPTVSFTNKTICSTSKTGVVLTNNIAGTVNTWTYSPQANITGPSTNTGDLTSSGTAPFVSTLDHLLTLTGSSSKIATYTITPRVGACPGSPSTLSVTVNPVPDISLQSDATQTICSGKSATINFSSGLAGATFSWNVTQSNANIPPATTGASITGQFFNADGANSGSATYSIIASAAGCSSLQPVSATVNILNTPAAPAAAGFPAYSTGIPVTMQLYVPTGYQAYWYADPVIATSFNSGPTFVTAPASYDAAVNTFYVSLRDMSSVCESPRAPFTLAFSLLISPPSITTEAVRIPGQATARDINALSTTQKEVTVNYIDGLSRTNQVVSLNATPSGKDIIQPVEYDSYGRTSKDYLPYSATTNSGAFQPNYQQSQLTFYSAANATPNKIAGDSYPYSVSNYEQSPLGRVSEQGLTGQAWQPGSQHTKRVTYSFNTGANANDDNLEEVRQLASDGSSTGFYAANTLSRIAVTDENGNTDYIFKDGSGHIVVRKQQLNGVINGNAVAYLQTYYVYDDLSRLKYIIPPAGQAALKNSNWSLTQPIIEQHLHQFVYDNRGRLTQKKTPGQDWIYYVYDKFNRLVLTQDANLRSLSKWAFVKYDRNGRSVVSGLYKNTTQTDITSMQTLVSGLYSAGISYETRGTTLYNYSNQSFPTANADASALEVYSVNYYDDYAFTFNNGSTPVYDNVHLAGLPANASAYTTGRLTGNRKLILNSTNWIFSAVFYDNYGRAIQTQGNNHLNLNGLDKSSVTYDFEGKVIQTKNTHSPDGTNLTTILQTPNYDVQGRVSKIYHSINGAANQLVAQYEYNELGQQVTKKLHGDATGTTFLQNVDYRFNIRGWLTSINNAQLANDANVTNGDTNDYFGMELLYNATEASGLGNTPYYNGNVSAVKWRGFGSSGVSGQSSYKLTYDNTDKLTAANFQKYGTTAWNQELNTLDETMSYDHNGNILSLQRNQKSITNTAQTIDNLTYSYTGNQLNNVADAATSVGFKDGNTTGNDYTYDTHGNITKDLNKGINTITYNPQGKAQQITFSNGNTVTYTYDASGNKLAMASMASGVTTTTNYAGGFVYTSVSNVNNNAPVLSFLSSPEGRVVKNSTGNYEYQYAITDHLGNTRVLFTGATQATQSVTAGFETANQATEATNFATYPSGSHINTVSMNAHSGSNSLYLNGGSNGGQVGLARSYNVYPGDQLSIQAYAKYNAPTGNQGNLSGFATALLNAFNLPIPAQGETGTPSAALNSFGGLEVGGWGDGTTDQTDPKVFVTILIFDNNYNFLDVAFSQLTSSGSLSASYTVKQPGHVYMYVSNEQQYQTDVYFDDITMSYTPSPIIQQNEYYPFGLQTANSWTRDNSSNNFLYNEGSELNTTTGMYDLPYRNYDAALGRFFQVDPLSVIDHHLTPYHYTGNNPVGFTDPTGLVEEAKQNDDEVTTGSEGNYLGWSNTDQSFNAAGEPARRSRYIHSGDPMYHDPWANLAFENAILFFQLGLGGGWSSNSNGNSGNSGSGPQPGSPLSSGEGVNGSAATTNSNPVYTAIGGATGIAGEAAKITEREILKKSVYATETGTKGVKVFGTSMAGLGLISSGFQYYNSGRKPSDKARLGGAVVIAATTFIPDVGPEVSFALGLVDSGGSFDKFYKSFDNPAARAGYFLTVINLLPRF